MAGADRLDREADYSSELRQHHHRDGKIRRAVDARVEDFLRRRRCEHQRHSAKSSGDHRTEARGVFDIYWYHYDGLGEPGHEEVELWHRGKRLSARPKYTSVSPAGDRILYVDIDSRQLQMRNPPSNGLYYFDARAEKKYKLLAAGEPWFLNARYAGLAACTSPWCRRDTSARCADCPLCRRGTNARCAVRPSREMCFLVMNIVSNLLIEPLGKD